MNKCHAVKKKKLKTTNRKQKQNGKKLNTQPTNRNCQ